ncbi:MAG: sigma-70 family RNA polymerase sigma factor [Candidatus Aegiribacteria sp.]|nr:sigma-70 family RNA polymerase sigma factor [Candidatus Aegiribacteria sp.]
MNPEEEKELAESQENVRFVMLESILLIPLGRKDFFEPFNRLLKGEIVEEGVVDRSFWGIKHFRLPYSRRKGMKLILSRMNNRYQNRDAVRRLHLSWFRVECIGKELFSRIETCRLLVSRMKELTDLLGEDVTVARMRALEFCKASDSFERETYRAWSIYPQLTAIRNELDLIEVNIGVGIHDYITFAQHFYRAFEKHNEILERFVEANLRLVVTKVRKYFPCDAMEEMDLVQEGCRGLMDAVRRFEYHRGYKFSTFAVWWIRQAILKAILRQSRLIRLPVSILKANSSFREYVDDFTSDSGHPPTIDELAELAGVDRDEIEQIYLSTARPLSLDHTTGEQDATIANYLESKFLMPDEEVIENDLRERIDAVLLSLSDREKTIITLRFGLFGGESYTLQDLGRIFRISRERVRQVESRALDKLRKHGLITSISYGNTI